MERQSVRERIAWLVAGARSGAGGALVVAGEPGSGKSTLLAESAARAGNALRLEVTGVGVESGIAHSGLHALLRPVTAHLMALPDCQREALAVALGTSAGPAPSPLLLGAATLTLLATCSVEQPVLVLVDDAQWVDEASLQAMTFAARRLGEERVGVLLATRTEAAPHALAGIERCDLAAVSEVEAVDVLAGEGLPADLAPDLVAAAGGNMLALVELARGVRDGRRSSSAAVPAGSSGAPVFTDRLRGLPAAAREAAALAALAGDAPPAVLAAAQRTLGLGPEVLRPAEEARLVVAAADGIRWRHPLVQEGVLEAVAPARRRALAGALAEAAVEVGAPDSLVVEFRVAAADAPDEQLALALERVAAVADAAGDHVRAARRWARAVEVGTDQGRRGLRLLGAAEATLRGGRLGAARGMYDDALEAGLDADGRTRAHLARGRIMHTAGSARLAVQELRAAADAAPSPGQRVRACAEGVLAAMYAGVPELARALAADAHAAHDPSRAAERMLALHARGAALCLSGDRAAGVPLLLASVEEAERHAVLDDQPDLVLWVITAPLFGAGHMHVDIGGSVAAAAIDRLRLRGDLLWLPRVVRMWAVRHLVAGRFLTGYATCQEAVELSRAAEQTTQLVEALGLLAELEALRGETEACLAHCGELRNLLATVDVPFLSSRGWYPEGLLHLGAGDAAAAAGVLAAALEVPAGVAEREDAVADLVEALVQAGRPAEATAAAEVAPSARAAGLLEPDDARAVELLLGAADAAAGPVDVARCRLLAGERLRRAGLRREAREQLRAAADLFAQAGAAPWRRRCEEELRASGESLGSGDDQQAALTGAELRVAALVAEGRPTREVAALLFLSPKTVEFHLSRIYRKLGVRGRTELARRLAGTGDGAG